MGISNWSPNQALQERHAHLRASRSFPRDNWVFEPKLPYPWLMWKKWKRNTVWAIDPKSGPIIAANKHIKQKRLKNHSQIKFTPSLLQRDSAPSLHERPYPSLRSYSCAPSQAKQLLKYLLVICPSLCAKCKLCDNFPSRVWRRDTEEEEKGDVLQEEEEKEDVTETKLEHNLTKLSTTDQGSS